MKKLCGVITAMTTPFDENGQVDVAALEAQTEFLILMRLSSEWTSMMRRFLRSHQS